MRIAVTGSIATDHLMTFAGLFSEQLLPDQLANLSVVFLADSLEVRRGGTGANISFGMGVLGQRPLLIGAVGTDAGDYLGWLADHGVDTTGVRVSSTLASPRFTVDNTKCRYGVIASNSETVPGAPFSKSPFSISLRSSWIVSP